MADQADARTSQPLGEDAREVEPVALDVRRPPSEPVRVEAVPVGGIASLTAMPPAARAVQSHRAGVVTRTLANSVDFVVVVAVLVGAYVGWVVLKFLLNPKEGLSFTQPDLARVFFGVIAGAIVMWVYLTLGWATTGRTYGASLLGLRVVGRHGQQLGWVQAAIRAAFCVVFPIGLFWSAVSERNRSVQDVVLRTSVVYDWSRRPRSGMAAAPTRASLASRYGLPEPGGAPPGAAE